MSLVERCPHFRGCTFIVYRLQWSGGPEDVSLLERCSHFRGCTFIVYRLQWSGGPEDVSLLERCPHFRGRCDLVHVHIHFIIIGTFMVK